MTDQELEQKLRTALEHAAPDDFQGVLARISPKTQTEQTPIPFEAAARKKKRRWAPLAAAFCRSCSRSWVRRYSSRFLPAMIYMVSSL